MPVIWMFLTSDNLDCVCMCVSVYMSLIRRVILFAEDSSVTVTQNTNYISQTSYIWNDSWPMIRHRFWDLKLYFSLCVSECVCVFSIFYYSTEFSNLHDFTLVQEEKWSSENLSPFNVLNHCLLYVSPSSSFKLSSKAMEWLDRVEWVMDIRVV